MTAEGATLNRCGWCSEDAIYQRYHDEVWGRPVSNQLELFEKLCLDGQQAGLSWITILRKQDSYREAYAGFDPYKVANFDEAKVEQLLTNPGIIRNRLKVNSIIKNARAYIEIEQEGIDFSAFLWSFVDGRPKRNQFRSLSEIPTATVESRAMSKALKKMGFSFVGETICYAFMQAVGMVNDHEVDCHCFEVCDGLAADFNLNSTR